MFNRKGLSTNTIITLFIALTVAGALFPTIMSQFANSTYTGLSGASATMAGLVPLFMVIGIVLWISRKK